MDLEHLAASKLSYHKAVSMIAKAVGKSEIIIQDRDGTQLHNEDYYRLNVQPNPNESGTYFWQEVAERLLTRQEALIVPIGGNLYRADSWTEDDLVMKPRKYTNIVIEAAGKSKRINRTYNAEDVIHIRYNNAKITQFLQQLLRQYDSLTDAVTALTKLAAKPKWLLSVQAQGNIQMRDKKSGETITLDNYAARLLRTLQEDKASIIPLTNGFDLLQLKTEAPYNITDLTAMTDAIDRATARAYDIPQAVFKGEITEKSDATNELITYAVSPVVEAINDALNSTIVGMDDYITGQRITLWTGNYKHRDLMDAAASLEKLRGIGFSFDEIRSAIGYVPLNTEFSTARALTKNMATEGMEETG